MKAAFANEVLFTAAEVAHAADVSELDLRGLEPEGFGSPGHWRMCKTGGVVYTPRGVEALAAVLEADGRAVPAHSLRVLVKERTEVPSSEPVPRKAPGEPWFRHGQME